jgi:hypothetical protein
MKKKMKKVCIMNFFSDSYKNAKCKMQNENVKWKMQNVKWKMKNEKWKMQNVKFIKK